jgi:iron complex outermembrane receptor protein
MVLWILLGLLLVSGAAFAEDSGTESDVYSLGEVVVKGERKGVEDIAITEEITAQEIESRNAKTLAEALKFAPGILVTTGRKDEPSVSIHGFPTENVLFLIDGIPYYETNFGKLNLNQIPTNIISRIVVTKNAPSVLYGPNGMVGVVNVITKKGTENPSFSVTGELGENDTHREGVSHGYQVGDFNYWLSYEHFETDGWEVSDDFEPVEGSARGPYFGDPVFEDGELRENSDRETDRFWARAGYVPSDETQYYVSFLTAQSEFGIPPGTQELRYFPPGPNDRAAFTTFWRFEEYSDYGLDVSGKQEITDWLSLRGKLYYHDHEDKLEFYDGLDYETVWDTSTFKDDYYGATLIADFDTYSWHTGHVSFNYRQDRHEERDAEDLPFNEFNSHTGSIGTEHELSAPWGLTAILGASYDWFKLEDAEDYDFDSNYNLLGQKSVETADTTAEINPMLGLTYELDPTTELYASVARKSRFPTLQDLGDNPDLDAQHSINYTLGGTKRLGSWLQLRASGYLHDIEDWITDEFIERARDVSYPINVGEIQVLGAELGLTLRPIEDLTFTAMHNIQDVENESPGAVVDEVPGFYENKTDLNLSYLVPVIDTRIDLHGIYVGEVTDQVPTEQRPDQELTETSSYFVMRGRVSKQFTDHLRGYMEVENITDRDYEPEVGFPGRGRSFLVGLKAEL